jgi:hypothetical protein
VIDAFELFADEIVKIDRELYIRTYGENALPGIAEGLYEREVDGRITSLTEDILETVAAAGTEGIPFGTLYEQMLVAHFGRITTGQVKKTTKALVKERKLTRRKAWWNAALDSDEVIRTAPTETAIDPAPTPEAQRPQASGPPVLLTLTVALLRDSQLHPAAAQLRAAAADPHAAQPDPLPQGAAARATARGDMHQAGHLRSVTVS